MLRLVETETLVLAVLVLPTDAVRVNAPISSAIILRVLSSICAETVNCDARVAANGLVLNAVTVCVARLFSARPNCLTLNAVLVTETADASAESAYLTLCDITVVDAVVVNWLLTPTILEPFTVNVAVLVMAAVANLFLCAVTVKVDVDCAFTVTSNTVTLSTTTLN
jgi:hypothetical protein